ncbi:putative tellurite resistance protein B-like protein [Agrobacterium vitis]|nr:putative tellurite resistance protein B-like protein [Agrobacterium vitis]MBE1437751.1 putative tellurite resistance protein B-like protein [Agrobacterium vitis]
MGHLHPKLELIKGGKDADTSATPIYQIVDDLHKLIKTSNERRYDMLSYLLEIALDEAEREARERG